MVGILLLAAMAALVEVVVHQAGLVALAQVVKEITAATVLEHSLQAVEVAEQAQSEIMQPQLVVETVVLVLHLQLLDHLSPVVVAVAVDRTQETLAQRLGLAALAEAVLALLLLSAVMELRIRAAVAVALDMMVRHRQLAAQAAQVS